MTGKRRQKSGLFDFGDIDPSLEQIEAVKQQIEKLDKKRVFLVGMLRALEAAAGVQSTTPPPKDSHVGATAEIANLGSLITLYKTNKDAGYLKARYRTRLNYDSLLKRINEVADKKLAGLKAQDIRDLYDQWMEGGKTATARGLVTMLRQLFSFGANVLGDGQCERLAGILHHMRFPMAKPRVARLSVQNVMEIIRIARDKGFWSIALAQAFQFECGLRQKDVIGEWVPYAEPGSRDTIDEEMGTKWLRGLQWSDIDQKTMMLRHRTSSKGKDIEVDLQRAPMVMEGLKKLGFRASGPIIVEETTGLPYRVHKFRRCWREIATAAGVPKGVFNMDTRAGTKGAIDAGASNGEKYAPRNHSPEHGDEPEKERPTESDLLSVGRIH
jgi:hypothetical protein